MIDWIFFKVVSLWINFKAHPGKWFGILAACIVAVLDTLVGKGVITPDTVETITKI